MGAKKKKKETLTSPSVASAAEVQPCQPNDTRHCHCPQRPGVVVVVVVVGPLLAAQQSPTSVAASCCWGSRAAR